MYTDHCGICRPCIDFCQLNNKYTIPHYNHYNHPYYPFNYGIDYGEAGEFFCFGRPFPKIPILPLGMTKTQILAELSKKSTKSKKKMPTKSTRRSTYAIDSSKIGARKSSGNERLNGTFVKEDSNDAPNTRLTYVRDDGKRGTRAGSSGQTGEGKKGEIGRDGNSARGGKGKNAQYGRDDDNGRGVDEKKGIYGRDASNGNRNAAAKNVQYGRDASNGNRNGEGKNGQYGRDAGNGNRNGEGKNGQYGRGVEEQSGLYGRDAGNGNRNGEGKNGLYGRGAEEQNGLYGHDASNGRNGEAKNGLYGRGAEDHNGLYGHGATNGRNGEGKNGHYGRGAEETGQYGGVSNTARSGDRKSTLYGRDANDDMNGPYGRDGANDVNNGLYAGGMNPSSQMHRNLAAQLCSKLVNDAASCCKKCTYLCHCSINRGNDQQNKPIVTKNGVPLKNVYNQSSETNDYRPYPNINANTKSSSVNTSYTNLATAQTSYSSQESNDSFASQNVAQNNSFCCIYNTQAGRNADSNGPKNNTKSACGISPKVYQMKCSCMASQQTQAQPQQYQQQQPYNNSCCCTYPDSPVKICRHLDVITEEYEPADYSNDYADYQNNTNYASNAAQTDDKPKTQKSIEDFCCDFLNIVCENILESVQKSMTCLLQEYCCQTMEKIEAMCCKFDCSEKNTTSVLCDLVERLGEQDDSNTQQFQMIMQSLRKILNNSNENLERANKNSSTPTPESPQKCHKGCQCNTEEKMEENQICCFVIDRDTCKAISDNGNILETANTMEQNDVGDEENAPAIMECCCCKIPAPTDVTDVECCCCKIPAPTDVIDEIPDNSPPNDDPSNYPTSEPTDPYGSNENVVETNDDANDDAAPSGNKTKCPCPEATSFTCIIENCQAACRQKSGAQVNDYNPSLTNTMDNGSSDKIRKMSALKFPSYLMTNQNVTTGSCCFNCNEKYTSIVCSRECRCHGEEDDTFETSGYATDPDDNNEEVASLNPTMPLKKTKLKRSAKRPTTTLERKRSKNPDVCDIPKTSSNSTKLSRL